MSEFDLVIRQGTVITPRDTRVADVGVTDGKISAIEPNLQGSHAQEIQASGLHIFPGLIDSHVHFNEPGRTQWEGIATGSRALAAGGGTMFFDMPLNAHPPTTDAAAFDLKAEAALANSIVDFALWGGLVPDNLAQLEELAERGVIGFKAFMSNSGIEDFPCVDDRTLRAGMKKAKELGRLVAVHAESESMTAELTQLASSKGKTGTRDYLDSRPIPAELDAIGRALELAGETGCDLHIVHVSCGAGIALVVAARKLGVKVTCETCPHYLAMTEDDMIQLGAIAKCAPPLRATPAQAGLWEYLKAEEINTIGSDHSPAPPEMKTDQNFFRVWGGISGVQHTLPLLLTEGHLNRGVALPLLARLTSVNVAARFNLPPGKGRLAPGADADIAIVDLALTHDVTEAQLLYRHRHSPWCGRALTGKVIQTILRGQTVFRNGKLVSAPKGRLIKPIK